MLKKTILVYCLFAFLSALFITPGAINTASAAESAFAPDTIDQGIQSLISPRLYNGVYLELKPESREMVRRYYELGSKENNSNFLMGLKNTIYFVVSLETVKQNLVNPPEKWKSSMTLASSAKDAIAGAPNTALQAIPILAKAEELDALDIKIADSYIAKQENDLAQQKERIAQLDKNIEMLNKLINAFEKVDGKL